MEIRTDQFRQIAAEEMANEYSRKFLDAMTGGLSRRRGSLYRDFPDPEQAKAYGIAVRKEAVARLPDLLEEFEENAVANGAKVLWARDAKEANQIVLDIAREKEASYLTKGKSMVTEEMNLNQHLMANGIETFETDLGELIAQLLERPPFHIVGPAINVPVEEVRDIFLEKGVTDTPSTVPEELGYAARLFLREKFHHLKMGITGVNMAVAETGTVVNVENEGNIRFNKSSPKTQVSIMSLEKVVPTLDDALFLLRILCRCCTGQKVSGYATFDNGPKKADEIDGPEELIIVIVDNGRSKHYHDATLRQAFQCIRCGICQAACPVYGKVGGYPYGWAYCGPVGQVLNPLLLGLEGARDLYRACTGCRSCSDVCPTGIEHSEIFKYYKEKEVESDADLKAPSKPFLEARFFEMWSLAVTHDRLWRNGLKMARPLVNKAIRKDGLLRRRLHPLEKWLAGRELPEIPKQTFHERWKEIKGGKP
ncbi:MAG: lactate utilization protein [Proteobacteria bacterium]|nr:lactate utilization protein [Pseudomonadota bacterium]